MDVTQPQFPISKPPQMIENKPSATNQLTTDTTTSPNNAGGTTKPSATSRKTSPKKAGSATSASINVVDETKNVVKNKVPLQKVESFLKGVVTGIAKLPTNKLVWGITGVLGSSAAIYSIAKDGTTKGLRDARQEEGAFYKKLYDNTSSSSYYSHLLEDIKDETHQTLFDHWIFPAFSKIKNVTKSVALETVRNVDNIAASAAALGALFIPTEKLVEGFDAPVPIKGNKIVKGIIGTAGAGYLLLKGGYTFIRDVLGFGKT